MPKKFLLGLVLVNLGLITLVFSLLVAQKRKSEILFKDTPAISALVNGKPLFARDVASSIPPDYSPEEFRTALDRQIREEIVAQQSAKILLEIAQIDQAIATIGHQFESVSDKSDALQKAGLNEYELRERISRHLKCEKWLQLQSANQPTEAECRAFYDAHPTLAAQPAVVQATHFAAIFPPRGTPEEFLEKGDLIRDAQTRLKSGIPFPQLIDALSDDPAKKGTQGSLSWFSRERMEPALTDAAFTQPLHQIGDPIETRFGFHLLRVDNRLPARTASYDDLVPEIQQRVRAEKQRKKIEAIVADLLQRAKIEIRDPRFQSTTL